MLRSELRGALAYPLFDTDEKGVRTLSDTASEILLQRRLLGSQRNHKTFCQRDRRGNRQEQTAIYVLEDGFDQRMIDRMPLNIIDDRGGIEKEAVNAYKRVRDFHSRSNRLNRSSLSSRERVTHFCA